MGRASSASGWLLGLLVLAFWPGLIESFAAPKAAILRVAGCAWLVLWTAEFSRGSWRPTPLDVAVLTWGASSVLSTLTSVAWRLSLLGEVHQREGLLTSIAMIGLYFAARDGSRSGDATAWPPPIRVALLLSCGYGLLQWLGVDLFHWQRVATYPAAHGAVLRPMSTLGNAILLGQLAALGLVVELARLGDSESGRGATFACVLVFGTTLAVTLSRGPWLAAAVGIALALWSGRHGRGRVQWAALALPIGVVLTLSVVAGRLPFEARLEEIAHADAVSTNDRLAIALGAWRAAIQRPLTGWGLDTFGLVFPRFQPASFGQGELTSLPVHAHTSVLQVLVTRGLAGLLAGAFVVFRVAESIARERAGLRRGLQPAAIGVITLLVASLANPLGLAGTAALVWLVGSIAARSDGWPERAKGRAAAPGLLPSMALAVGFGMTILGAREMVGLHESWLAMGRYEAGLGAPQDRARALFREAAERARRASLAPGGGELPLRQRVDALLAGSRLLAPNGEACALVEDAIATATRAVREEPLRAEAHQRLGDALAASVLDGCAASNWRRAENAFTHARALAPRDPWTRLGEARARLEIGDAAGALRIGDELHALYPHAPWGVEVRRASLSALAREAAHGTPLAPAGGGSTGFPRSPEAHPPRSLGLHGQ